ncbi:MAG TPA: polysaccharide deacetylase family protein, partial [Candidatus Methylomirabilis sp.]
MGPAAVILMYHGLRPEADGERDPDIGVERYVVSGEDFARQMRWLRDAGFASVPLGDFVAGGGGAAAHGRRPLGLTFDDGRRSDHRLALPILREVGFHATFFIVTDWIGRPGFLSRGEVRELAGAGMEIGSHTVSHRFLSELSEQELRRELGVSRARLEDLTGRPVRFLALPGGRCSRAALRLAREAGYRGVCTSRVGAVRPGGGAFRLCRVPVLGGTPPARFRRLVEPTPWGLGWARALAGVRRAVRRAVGRRAYEGIRDRVLARQWR